jgi:hypothetical protein
MKYSLTFLLALLFSFGLFAQQPSWSKVKIDISQQGLQGLAMAGIDVTSGFVKRGEWFETDLSEGELELVTEAGYSYETLIFDVSAFYAQRAQNDPYTLTRDITEEWPTPLHWELGSMGGFYTLDEVMNELDEMHSLYPNLISERAPLSTTNLSHEGRMQYWVRLSDNPDVNEDEPEILYTGLHHAREPMSVQQMIWYMWHLLENYDTDPDIQVLVNNTEMYFIPVVNVDGYEYNYQTNPNGGGMWRKNRRNNGGSYGVDPNRNYGYKWGLDNEGSSPDPSNQTYRGPSAFSEPITQNVRDFCNDYEFKIAMNYHSYSDLLLYSWGYTPDVSPDDELFHELAVLMTKENHYTVGPGSTTIYPVNGDSNDWMYGEQETKDKTLAYTPEVGNGSDGFWPSTSRIVPLCQEQMWQNITAARLVGKYAKVIDQSPIAIKELSGYFKYNIKRLGLTDCDTFMVSIQPVDPSVLTVGDANHHENMTLLQAIDDSISFQLAAGTESGTTFKYILSVDNGEYILSDTISKVYGSEVVIFEDDCEDMDNWTSSRWNITTEDYHSPVASITDSPNSHYNNNQTSTIYLDTTIDLSGISMAFLNFWAKWSIETGYDYLQVSANANNGTWVPLSGNYTIPGNSNQAEGEPIYDGNQEEWVKEKMSLSAFAGETITLRFQLKSDAYEVRDGFYFDDLNVTVIGAVTGINNKLSTEKVYISNVYPNPADDQLNVDYNLNGNRSAAYQLLSITGSSVIAGNVTDNSGTLHLNTAQLPAGIYYFRLISNNESVVRKAIVK